jgi:hypothetical protein
MKTKNPMNPMKNFSTFGRVLNVLPFKLKIMKNWMMFLTLILMMSFASCNKTIKEKSTEAALADSTNPCPCDCPPTRSTAEPTCKYCVLPSQEDHSIKFSEVQSMLLHFNQEYAATISNCGGFLSGQGIFQLVDTFETKQSLVDVSTLCFYPWFRQGADPSSTILSLGAEQNLCDENASTCGDNFERAAESILIPNQNAYIPRIDITTLKNAKLLKTYFETGNNFPTTLASQNVLSTSLGNQMQQFRNTFNGYHPSPLTAFGKSASFEQMGNPTTNRGYLFFWGLDYSQEPKVQGDVIIENPHTLRVIFCAVNAAGNIIVPDGNWDIAFRESSRPRRP